MLLPSVKPGGTASQEKTPDVVVPPREGARNSGTALAVPLDVVTKLADVDPTDMNSTNRAPQVSFRSVFEVGPGGSRLAIGHFNRPLLEAECATLRRAWERAKLPEVVDFEVTPKQVSFLSTLPRVDAAWRSIDSILAASPSLAKAS